MSDQGKIFGVLDYLEGLKEEVLKLIPQGVLRVVAYLDASFLMHQDGKSQSGVIVLVGGAPIYFRLKNQKCVSKSPIEAELVLLLDNVGVVELLQEFQAFMMNTALPDPVVFHDSPSVITLVMQGGDVPCMKYMRTRMDLVCEAVEEQEMLIRYVGTKEMKADGLTKVLEGADFKELVNVVLGRTSLNKSTGERWADQQGFMVGARYGTGCRAGSTMLERLSLD